MRAHRTLGVLMQRRLAEENLASDGVTLQASTEILQLLRDIQGRSQIVNSCAGEMKAELGDLVNVIETGEPVKKKKSFMQRLFGWVKKILLVVAAALSALVVVLAFLYPPGAALAAKFGTLTGTMAGYLHGIGASFYGNRPTHIEISITDNSTPCPERLLALLRDIIPAQAERVAQGLSNFQYCNLLLQRELELQKGQIIRLDRQQARHALLQWEIHNIGMDNIAIT